MPVAIGAVLEQEVPEIARLLVGAEPTSSSTTDFASVLAYTTLHAPSFSLRGGAREILRGIIARGPGAALGPHLVFHRAAAPGK